LPPSCWGLFFIKRKKKQLPESGVPESQQSTGQVKRGKQAHRAQRRSTVPTLHVVHCCVVHFWADLEVAGAWWPRGRANDIQASTLVVPATHTHCQGGLLTTGRPLDMACHTRIAKKIQRLCCLPRGSTVLAYTPHPSSSGATGSRCASPCQGGG